MDAHTNRSVGFQLPAWVGDLPTWLLQTLWLVLGALGGLLAPLATVVLRRHPATQAASTAVLPLGVLSFQAAADLNDSLLGVGLAILASLPPLLALRGAW